MPRSQPRRQVSKRNVGRQRNPRRERVQGIVAVLVQEEDGGDVPRHDASYRSHGDGADKPALTDGHLRGRGRITCKCIHSPIQLIIHSPCFPTSSMFFINFSIGGWKNANNIPMIQIYRSRPERKCHSQSLSEGALRGSWYSTIHSKGDQRKLKTPGQEAEGEQGQYRRRRHHHHHRWSNFVNRCQAETRAILFFSPLNFYLESRI